MHKVLRFFNSKDLNFCISSIFLWPFFFQHFWSFFFFFIVAWFYYWFPFPNNFSSSSLLLFKLLTITRKNSISSLLLNGIFNIKNKLYFAFFFHQSISWSHACNIFTKWKKNLYFSLHLTWQKAQLSNIYIFQVIPLIYILQLFIIYRF